MFKGYRTIIFNALAAIIPILETAGVSSFIETYGTTAVAGYALAITVGNAILRFLTDTKVGESK